MKIKYIVFSYYIGCDGLTGDEAFKFAKDIKEETWPKEEMEKFETLMSSTGITTKLTVQCFPYYGAGPERKFQVDIIEN